MNLDVSGIYQIRNKINGKIYVGQAVNIRKRIYRHRGLFSRCVHLCNAIKKYGWDNFDISILELVDDPLKLTEREQYWLDTLKSYNNEKGYNICPVAKSVKGIKHSEETKIKMSMAHIGKKCTDETRAKMKASRIGRKYSNEFRAKISTIMKNRSREIIAKIAMANTGKKRSEESRAKMSIAHLGKKQTEEAKVKIGIASRNISNETRAKLSAAHKNIRNKPVNQICINTNTIVHTWNSASEASRILSINRSNICSCCRYERKTANGYIWQFAEITK